MSVARVGDVVAYQVRGFTLRGMALQAGPFVLVAGITFEHGRMAMVRRELPAEAVEVSARAGSPRAVSMARDLMHTPHATVLDAMRAAWKENGSPT